MNATAADYRWLGDHCPELIEAYCVTLVHAVSPEEALRRLRARADGRVAGIAALVGAAARAWGGVRRRPALPGPVRGRRLDADGGAERLPGQSRRGGGPPCRGAPSWSRTSGT
ncbi:DUF6461 domain-containing protein [Streptomyces somaliensis]|uniref:DUF6461 domain-containing protein n=1 Tax=Streptomyces somaliensis TaxID=78355 RepID=UPI0020CEF1AD|nr:DUF6461 domain-containing protein [Streptomyces somaliensis]